MTTRYLLFLSLFMMLVSCAAPLSEADMITRLTQDARYPDQQFLKYVGVSAESLDSAEKAARLGIAQQIQSKIQSTYNEIIQETARNQDHNVYRDIRSEITIQTDFQYNNAIMTARSEAVAWQDAGQKRYLVLAFLEKGKLRRLLAEESQSCASEFLSHVAGAANTNETLARRTYHIKTAEAKFQTLLQLNLPYIALFGTSLPHFNEYRTEQTRLLEYRRQMLQGLVFCLRFGGSFDEAEKDALQGALSSFLLGHGLTIRQCADLVAKPGNFIVETDGDRQLGSGYLRSYGLKVNIALCPVEQSYEECGPNALIRASGVFRAYDQSPNLARKKLLTELLPDSIQNMLLPKWQEYFPL
jgi:hypothetical protein